MSSVEFGGLSITHVEKRTDAVDNGEEDDAASGPPSVVSSEDVEPKRQRREVREGPGVCTRLPPTWCEPLPTTCTIRAAGYE